MAVQASKSVSLTELATGTAFKISANQILNFTAINAGADSQITYIDNRDNIIVKEVQEAVATINTAAARTQAVTLNDAASTVIYIHSDKIIFIDDLTTHRQILYNGYTNYPVKYNVTEAAAAINTAAENTFAITIQQDLSTRYINNLYIDAVTTEGIDESATLSLRMKPESYTVSAAGTGYTSLPTVAVTGGGGTGATATATNLKAVSDVVSAVGTSYAPADTITLTGGTFSVATILTVIRTRLVSTATNAAGTGYATGDTITLAGGTFSTAAVLSVATTQLVSTAVNAQGTGYNIGDTVTLAGGTFSSAAIITVDTIGGAGELLTFTISTPGSYTVETAAFTQGATSGGGTGATFNLGLFGVLTQTVSTAGSYTANAAAFTQSATSGAGTGATFNTVVYGAETANVTTAGVYTVIPANPVAQGASSGAGTGATFTMAWGLNAIALGAAGSGFTSMPTVTVSGGAGTGATAAAVMEVDTIAVTDGGTNYTVAPTLAFSGGGGSLAAATVTIDAPSGEVVSVAVTNPGGGYTSFPTLVLSGGAGCNIAYNSQGTALQTLQVAQTAGAIQTIINTL